ncbi:MAG: malonate transporter subunit MadM [Verrucomicrobia bacterium]|jgi:malonate transporter MadM subunit|nr:MAG: malonate transporter subunit MadM [Verrucomicrobiota bacterium]
MIELLRHTMEANGLLTAFVVVGVMMWVSNWISKTLTGGRLHGSAIAVFGGLILAYVGGVTTGGKNGITDIPFFAGIGLMGGAMFRDFAIVATAFGASFEDLKRSGVSVMIALALGITVSFVSGAGAAYAFGYHDAVTLCTIGAGAATYIVGPVTGTALGASSEAIALSIAAGLVKAIVVMIATPHLAKKLQLNNPHTAMVYGGMMGTHSGIAAGLQATDPKLMPYGLMAAAFYTGLGCLVCPSIFYFILLRLLP